MTMKNYFIKKQSKKRERPYKPLFLFRLLF
nr:MAG TPA: hypothetical protein [Caudoviricetes sp.]